MIVYGTQSPVYKAYRSGSSRGKNNGAYFYPLEIENDILTDFKDLNLLVITAAALRYHSRHIPDGSIVVCHDYIKPLITYAKLLNKDVLWVCSSKKAVKEFKDQNERAVFIPLSIDVDYVKQFKRRKTKDTAFVGNIWSYKKEYVNSLEDVDILTELPRDELLSKMARYKHVIAEGRCQMEALALGCKVSTPKFKTKTSILYKKPIDTKDVYDDWKFVLEAEARRQSRSCIIRAMRQFNDLLDKTTRRKGDVFRVSKERAKELLSNENNIVEEL